MRLNGTRVVIVGGSSGIGLETARLAARRGSIGYHRWQVREPAPAGGRKPGRELSSRSATDSRRRHGRGAVDPGAIRRRGSRQSCIPASRGTPARRG